ncbi:MAG: spermidine synthase, partial [Pseudomonadota bacterium]|nr:spermidine synthase [Pseudomonadota bacterium]
LTENGVLVANTFSTSNLYHHESNSYREVFGSFLNYRRKDTGNRVILIPEAKKPTAERTRPTKSDLEERARQLETALEPYGVDIVRLSKDVAALYNKKPDWNPRKRPLSDQYSPANLLRKR